MLKVTFFMLNFTQICKMNDLRFKKMAQPPTPV